MSVDITEPTSLERAHAAAGPLGRAALAALRAPAVLDSQPWRWRLRGHVGELWADHTADTGPVCPGHSTPRDDRLVMLCCGIALHHVTTALPALGRRAEVTRLPEPARPELAAVLHLTGRHRPTPEETRAYQAMLGRRLIPPAGTITAVALATIPDPVALIHAPDVLPANGNGSVNGQHNGHGGPNGGRNGGGRANGHGGPNGPGEPAGPVAGAPIPGEVLVDLRQVAEESGAHLHVPRATVLAGPGTPGAPTAMLASGTDDALLCANTDDAAGWLAAGEALSGVLILAAQRGVTVRPLPRAAGPAGTCLPLPVEQGHPMLALRLSSTARH